MKSLYRVEWKTPGNQWCEFHNTHSLRDARAAMRQALRVLVHAENLTVRIQRWVRPGSPGTHGWLKERGW